MSKKDPKPVYLKNKQAANEARRTFKLYKQLIKKAREHVSTKDDFQRLAEDPKGYALEKIQDVNPKLAELKLMIEKIASLAGVPLEAYVAIAYQLGQFGIDSSFLDDNLQVKNQLLDHLIEEERIELQGQKAETYHQAQEFIDHLNKFQEYLNSTGRPNFPILDVIARTPGKGYEVNPAPIIYSR